MQRRSSLKRSKYHLKRIVEEAVAEECRLSGRGLAFLADEIEVRGRPPEHLRVWATLHFLPLGSPFCCYEPSCHLFLFMDRLARVEEAVQRRMGLAQRVGVEFVSVGVSVHEGVTFEGRPFGPGPALDREHIDARDPLGRTALMRAAERGDDRAVEELLAAGADPSVTDHRGRSILERVPRSSLWIIAMLERALVERRERQFR